MRTREHRDDDGRLVGFEISNLIITRTGVQRVVTRIPGAAITKSTRSWRWSADDDFLYFVLNGHTFFAIEPYGDSDCYCIFAKDAPDIAEISVVKREFEKHQVWKVI